MKIKLLSTVALVCGLFAGSAHAVFIAGSISFSDGFDLVPSPPDLSCIVNCGTGTYDINNAVNVYAPGSATGDFVGTTSAAAADVDVAALPFDMFTTDTGFTFTVTAINLFSSSPLACAGGLCGDSIEFNLAGVVSGAGFDDTAWLGRWTANGTCRGGGTRCGLGTQSASWSASVVALGEEPDTVPNPGTLLLLGAGLAGLRLVGRRKASM
jgi:PEP-CTERM motif